AEAQRADQQAGDDLVANAEKSDGIEHTVAQGYGRRHGDHVAAEQRQIHSWLPLGHAVAHRRNPARDLRRRTHFAGEYLHLLGVAAVGLMRREHVVVSGYNADVGTAEMADRLLVLGRRSEAV